MAKKGGRQPGSGRPKGSLNKTTLEQKVVAEEIRQRVLRSSGALINSQMGLAKGLTFLYVIKTKKGKRGRPELVKSQAKIEAFLADELDNDDEVYYFMSTDKPDNGALNSLLERGVGKVSQPLSGDPENPIVHKIVGMKVIKENGRK